MYNEWFSNEVAAKSRCRPTEVKITLKLLDLKSLPGVEIREIFIGTENYEQTPRELGWSGEGSEPPSGESFLQKFLGSKLHLHCLKVGLKLAKKIMLLSLRIPLEC